MKKCALVVLFCIFVITMHAQDNSDKDSSTLDSETVLQSDDDAPVDFEDFLSAYIGQDIVIYVADLDVTMNGRLLYVLKDGLIIQPIFRQKIFILKKSIAFVEVKGSDKKKTGKK